MRLAHWTERVYRKKLLMQSSFRQAAAPIISIVKTCVLAGVITNRELNSA